MRKKLLVLTAAAVFTLTACSFNGNASGNSINNSSAAASTPYAAEDSDSAESISITSLADWIDTDEAKDFEDEANAEIKSQGGGMSVELNFDGNVFIYEYYLNDSLLETGSLTPDELAEGIAGLSELNDSFTFFEDSYNIKLDAIRVTVYTTDGTELASAEVAPEDIENQ